MADGFKDPLMGKLVMFISGAKFQVRTSTLRLAPTATPLTASHRHPAGRVRSHNCLRTHAARMLRHNPLPHLSLRLAPRARSDAAADDVREVFPEARPDVH